MAAWVEWVASEDTPKPEPGTHEGTVDANTLNRISGTRRFETTHVAKQRCQGPLIHTN